MSETESLPERRTRDTVAAPSPDFAVAGAGGSADIHPGEMIGRYLVRGLLGSGGMGHVYTAFDPELGRTVALKLIRPDGRVQSSSSARTRLLREAHALAKLQHPNVVAIHDVGTQGNQVFIAMELIAGKTLGDWLGATGRTWRAIRDVFVAAGRGLAAAHEVGIVHRDFKPSNVIVGADRVVVVDFGLACARGDEPAREDSDPADVSVLDVNVTLTGERVGTPRYMAPEQHTGGPITAHADQFAFATALWTALYGAPPFPGESSAAVLEGIARRAPSPAAERNVPQRVRAALARALAYRPADRWPSLADLLAELTRDPAAARRRLVAILGLSVAAIATPLAFFAGRQAFGADRCDGGERLAARVWDDAARARARSAFLATGGPTAGASFDRVDAAMRDKLAVWAADHRDTCEATRVRHEQSETLLNLRMSCLERTRGEMSAFVDALGRDLDGEGVSRAVAASARTLDLVPCHDAKELQAAVPPRDPEAARLLTGLGAELDRMQADVDLGRVKSALTQARALLPRVRAAAFAPALARALLITGKLEVVSGDVETGIDTLYQATRAAGEAHDDVIQARALAALIRPVGTLRGRLDEAARLMTLAEGATARAGNDPDILFYLLQQEGNFFNAGRHDTKAALARLYLGLAIEQNVHGLDYVDVGGALNNIANVERSLGRTQDALAHYRRALEIYLARLGPDHPGLSAVVNNIGAIDQDTGNYEAAGELYQRGLEQSERNFGPDSEETAISARNLAGIWLLTGRLTEARDLADRAVRISLRVFGAKSPKTADGMDLAAIISFEEGKLEDAIAGHRDALTIIQDALGPESPALVSNLLGLSDAELAAGHIAEARHAATHAVTITRKVEGDLGHQAEAMMREANVLTKERRYADAISSYERALEFTEKACGSEHPQVMALLTAAVESLIGSGQFARAVAFAERAHAIASKHGPNLLADGERTLAIALVAQGNGQDSARALALARAAHDRLEGTGYRRIAHEIDVWLADATRQAVN